jgi:hypothetical protein
MIKVNNGNVKFKGNLPTLSVELITATRGLVDVHMDAGIPMEAALHLVRQCVELALAEAAKAAGPAPESSEEAANV